MYSIRADGRDRRFLSPTLTSALFPTWSPNGKRIAFTANSTEVYVANADGTKLTKIFSGEDCKSFSIKLAWVANNQQLAFTQSCDGSTLDSPGSVSLYLSTPTGIAGTRLIKTWDTWYEGAITGLTSNVAFSPDGKQAAFVNEQGTYKINTDGSKLVKLAPQLKSNNRVFSQMQWSPNGAYLARTDISTDAPPKLQILKPDGKVVARLTKPEILWNGAEFAWSPDGNGLIYPHLAPSSTSSIRQDLYLWHIPSQRLQKLTSQPGEYESVLWSPNGQQIAFTRKTANSVQLYTLTIAPLAQTELTRSPFSSITDLAWSPDGQHLAFVGVTPNQKVGLWIVDRSSRKLQPITQNEDIFNPVWQP